jgi:hypothetical protein
LVGVSIFSKKASKFEKGCLIYYRFFKLESHGDQVAVLPPRKSERVSQLYIGCVSFTEISCLKFRSNFLSLFLGKKLFYHVIHKFRMEFDLSQPDIGIPSF